MNQSSDPVIRCEKRWAIAFSHIIWSPLLFAVFLLGAALWAVLALPDSSQKLIAIPLVAVALIIVHQLYGDYQWVECDGKTIRAKGFWFRNAESWSITQIESIHPMLRRNYVTEESSPEQLMEAIAGMEIRFRDDLPPITMSHSEFTFVPELCLFLLEQIRSERPAP
ncbi:hypothetical protein [Bremerella sp.]|uniref:hypothetical protein n=1 Tax=Bremerella sp. TaxID=2795602 RepID=UPI003919511D